MSIKVLCVDDDVNILAGFQRNLRKHFSIDIAEGGELGLASIEKNGPYAVIVSDMQMPGMSGVQFLAKAEALCRDTVRIMLTGNADQQTAVDAVNKGHVFHFLTKPCLPETLAMTLQAGIKQHRLITAERELLEKTLNGSVKVLTDILSMIDPLTFGRSEALREYARAYSAANPTEKPWELEIAAMLSQIGMVTLPPALLQKIRACLRLTGPEQDILDRVPEISATLVENIPRLESVAEAVRYQEKNFDGTGFPLDAFSGESIPHGARVLRILIDLSSMESRGSSRSRAIAEMQTRTGVYDPQILKSAAASFNTERQADSATGVVTEVVLADLHAGQMLVDKIETRDGVLIVGGGTLVTPMLLEKLRNFAQLGGVREPIRVEAAA